MVTSTPLATTVYYQHMRFWHMACRVSTFGGKEWWNGIVEWTTGMVECFIGHT